MAKAIPIKPRTSGTNSVSSNKPIAIIASKFNKSYVDALIESCVEELKDLLPSNLIHVVRVPGANEIPVTIKQMSFQDQDFGCYIALGLILQGETQHGNLISNSVSQALMNLSLDLTTPIINEVLHVENEQQAQARCHGKELNRGIEAARSAYSMMNVFNNLK